MTLIAEHIGNEKKLMPGIIKEKQTMDFIFTTSIVKFLPAAIWNRLWRWQYLTRKRVTRPFRRILIFNKYDAPILFNARASQLPEAE